MAGDRAGPRTFLLNESHELVRGVSEGGGRPAKYVAIDWTQKAARLRRSILATRATIDASRDPLRDRRYFILATPEAQVTKESTAKNKPPTIQDPTHYYGAHSRVFRRLGLDLLHVIEDGRAIVHAFPEDVSRLTSSAAQLSVAGKTEQARWATIRSFEPVPDELRLDAGWLRSMSEHEPIDMVIELQPLLSVVEADEVLRTIARQLDPKHREALVGAGSDFSGRQWVRGRAFKRSLAALAKSLYSIDAIHPPIRAAVFASGRGPSRGAQRGAPLEPPRADEIARLPVVAVVDCGVPLEHPHLTPYRRGSYVDQNSLGVVGDHGSKVASRVVYGEFDYSPREPLPRAACRFLDVIVSEDAAHVDGKRVVPAMEAVVAAYPDVRVFNLSFGEYLPLAAHSAVDRRERLILLRDLDNFVFARDVIVVVSAGNSRQGVQPLPAYPDHVDDPNWAMNSWPMGHNSLSCGSIVGRPRPTGLGRDPDMPSPFTRIGPGMAGAPAPDYAAAGGDCTADFRYAPELGVWVSRADGLWEDHCGTSYAAPLLAREAAFALQHLQASCVPGASPFGVAVKAFLALTATRANYPTRLEPLVDRTVGRGLASARRLSRPEPQSAVFLWQGILDGRKDIARIQLPIPRQWRRQAASPRLRLVWAWDPPVNDAVWESWACRHVSARLKPEADSSALRGEGRAHKSYPLVDRSYDLTAAKLDAKGVDPSGDMWLVELSYDETAEYSAGIEFSPQQRVAFAAELIDEDEQAEGPQAAVQRLPLAASMLALGVPRARVQVPTIIRLRR
jgi:hypothetical protein